MYTKSQTTAVGGGSFSCIKDDRHRNSVTEFEDCHLFETLFSLRAAMAEERFISTCDLSSFSISSPDSAASTASLDNIFDSGNSSWGYSPPLMPDGNGHPLLDMKSLRDGLPSRKRGLSNFFTGKSQSFTSLADVKCVEDLAKPEKKLKSSHSWESTIKSSYNNQTIRSQIVSAGSAESNGAKMGKTATHELLQATAIASKTRSCRTNGQQTNIH